MNENNELSDIVLNKNTSSGSNKKILFAVATLGVILIAVVTLMRSCGSDNIEGAPQAVIPPKPSDAIAQESSNEIATDTQEPLFEEVKVVEEESVDDADLDKIAQKLKHESIQEKSTPVAIQPKPVTKPVAKKSAPKPVVKKPVSGVSYYVQVGSFTKFEPNKKFLASIKNLGYNYKYHKLTVNGKILNKVLVGPFRSGKEAKDARRILRAKLEPGAFLVRLK
ncbi:MAG: SPOR domain-containing protein [Epsilonproteobacteria bacterium]|nr:SPOR domain-containing protein [Campylobacterota bacterium]